MKISNINFTSNYLYLSLINFIQLNDINGGAIYISLNDKTFNCQKSFFLNCSANNVGGAIYFSSSNGNFLLNECCSYYCYSNEHSFCYSSLQSSTNNLNQFNFTSNSFCSFDLIYQRYYLISIEYGSLCCLNYNSSFNFIKVMGSGPRLLYGNNIYFKFCTNFQCISDISIIYAFTNPQSIFQYTNLVNNSKSNDSYGLFHINTGTLILKNFIFLGNYMSIFYIMTGSIELFDCFLDHFQYRGIYPNIGTCNTNIETNTYFFNHCFCNFFINSFQKRFTYFSKISNFKIFILLLN